VRKDQNQINVFQHLYQMTKKIPDKDVPNVDLDIMKKSSTRR